MSNTAPVKLDLDLIFSKLPEKSDCKKSLLDAARTQITPTALPIKPKKKHAYRFVVENGGGIYLTEASLDKAKVELLKRYKKILTLEKVST